MTENWLWRMECLCGTPSCRKIIGAYDNMPQNVREKCKGYISKWLVQYDSKKNKRGKIKSHKALRGYPRPNKS